MSKSRTLSVVPPGTGDTASSHPALTEDQQARLLSLFLEVELAGRDISPDSIAKAIVELIQARQQNLDQILQQYRLAHQALSLEGWQLSATPNEKRQFVYAPLS